MTRARPVERANDDDDDDDEAGQGGSAVEARYLILNLVGGIIGAGVYVVYGHIQHTYSILYLFESVLKIIIVCISEDVNISVYSTWSYCRYSFAI